MIALDASVLIGFLFDQDAHHGSAVALLAAAVDELFGVSTLTLAEVLVVPARLGWLAAAERMMRDLGVTEVPLPAHAALELTRLRSETNLKMPDRCLVLAAQEEAAPIATFDARLAKAAAALGIAVVSC